MDLISMQPQWQELDVSRQAHVPLARKIAGNMSLDLGFSRDRQADIMLSVSEMAQNHVKHRTVSGRICFFGQRLPEYSVMSISSLDMGPGITNLRKALRDGVSSSNGLGSGLGCIRRKADRFAICSGKFGDFPCPDLLRMETESVTLVSAEFYSVKPGFFQYPVDLSYLIRPASRERFCGDGCHFTCDNQNMAIVVMDALGHGREAAEALSMALDLVRLMPASADPADVLLEAGKALVHSRGVSAQALRIDLSRGRVDTAAVGNVNQYLYIDGQPRKITGHPGMLGPVVSRSNMSLERIENFSSVLGLVYSDGLGSVPELKFQQSEAATSALLWTHYLFSCCSLARMPADDATLVVWKWQP